jgi:sugar lactone lactonase YvrE
VSDFIDTGLFTRGIEGPDFDKNGNLYVVNFKKQGTIGIIDRQGNASLFFSLPEGSTGNGICFDRFNNMFIADYTGHQIIKIYTQTGKTEIFAFEPLMNQPNDVCIKGDGTLFASDPNWKNQTGKLWKINPDGKTHCLDSLMGTTNGIALSPDGQKLYVNESVQRKIWVYNLTENNEPINKKLFYAFDDYGLDGMRCDNLGRLFVTRFGKGTVLIFNPDGSIVKEILLKGKNPTNLAIYKNYCYVTEASRKCIEYFPFM